MFELFSDMYFIVYKLYYVGQNNDLGMRVRLRNWNGGSIRIIITPFNPYYSSLIRMYLPLNYGYIYLH
jgi:hypothetical protein